MRNIVWTLPRALLILHYIGPWLRFRMGSYLATRSTVWRVDGTGVINLWTDRELGETTERISATVGMTHAGHSFLRYTTPERLTHQQGSRIETLGTPKSPRPSCLGPENNSRQRPTLPHSYPCSTIGGRGLNCRVRYGNGCFPSPMTTGKTNKCKTEPRTFDERSAPLDYLYRTPRRKISKNWRHRDN